MRRVVAAGAALLASCGGGAYTAVEPAVAGDVRVAVAIGGGQRTIQALDARQAFRPPLEPAFAAGASLDVWIFGYSLAALSAEYPAIAGKTPAEAALELGASFEAPAAPEAGSVAHGVVAEDGPAEVPFARVTWSEWINSGAPAFGFTTPKKVVEPPKCPAFPISKIGSPTDMNLDAAAALSDTRLIAGGTDGADEVFLIGVEGARASRIPLRRALPGGLISLVRASDGSVYGLRRAEPAGESSLFHVSASGGELPAPMIALGAEPRGLSAGADGQVIAFGGNGTFDFVAGSTRTRARTDVVPTVRFMAAPSSTRILAADARTLYVYDGRNWRREHTLGVLEMVFTVAADDAVMLAAGEGGITILRDETSGTWRPLEAPFGLGRLLRTSAPLGNGRFAVGGSRGILAVRLGAEWCPIEYDTELTIRAMASSPSRKTLFVIVGDQPPILSIAMPP